LLAEPLREPLTYQARRDVRTASGREANNDAHRPRRIGLCPSEARDGRQRGSARCEMEKISAGEIHCLPLCNASDATLYSALILAARITFAHLAVSDLMTRANSSGELRDASRPSARSARARQLAWRSARCPHAPC